MQINLEAKNQHSIQAYSENKIRVNDIDYSNSLLLNANGVIPNWPVHSIKELTMEALAPILDKKPEIIILGHAATSIQLPMAILEQLSKQRIGIECMSIGAASRTFNVLLSEHRAVAIAIILS